MSASLVGSEMCIRDSPLTLSKARASHCPIAPCRPLPALQEGSRPPPRGCLLYTSDAADDM
eukprot:9947978-Alexandrium_andersonii.AAC.1